MRSIGTLLLAALVTAVACGDDTPRSPTGPSTSQQQGPNLVAGWSGTLTVAGVLLIPGQTAQRATNICNQSWVITSQSGGRFSGTWQSSGGTIASCAQAGTLTGTVSASGQISDLQFGASVGTAPPSGFTCTRVSGSEVFAGIASNASITAQAADRLRCSGAGGTADLERTMDLSMTRR